jgi:hypothetical protein
MEEIKVGEYVRTIDGYIRKVVQVNRKGSYEGLCYCAYSVDKKYKNSVGISAKKIKLHSLNIIDLIEEGDYVNGGKVVGKDKNSIVILTDEGQTFLRSIFEEKYIKTVVTKEQFESIEYKVEE